jgi:hypothetical protein
VLRDGEVSSSSQRREAQHQTSSSKLLVYNHHTEQQATTWHRTGACSNTHRALRERSLHLAALDTLHSLCVLAARWCSGVLGAQRSALLLVFGPVLMPEHQYSASNCTLGDCGRYQGDDSATSLPPYHQRAALHSKPSHVTHLSLHDEEINCDGKTSKDIRRVRRRAAS